MKAIRKKTISFFRIIFLFLLIFVWIFSGWPKIWQNPNFPPKIETAYAAASVTAATGGSAISADSTGGSYTTLTGPTIVEGANKDIGGSGTIVLSAPSGFQFNTGATVTATITRTAGSSTCFTFSSTTATPTTTTITFTVTASDSASGNPKTVCQVAFSNIQVRPTAGTPLASGNITQTGTNSGAPTGATNYGTLTEVVGAKNKLAVTTQPSTSALRNTNFATNPVVKLQDQFGNTVTTDSASTVTRTAVLSSQACGGTAGSGTLTSTPASGAAVSSGVMTYTAMQYSAAESIKICFSSTGVTSALSGAVSVLDLPTVTTQSASSVEAATATGNGNITATGGENNTKRGFVYDTSSKSLPGNTAPGSSGYASYAEDTGSYGTGTFTKALSSLNSGTTYYTRAYSYNSQGYSYGNEVSFLTKPAAPTGVAATDGTYTNKVTITWTKSTGATDYHVWRDSTDLGAAGDVATFDDTGAAAPTITPGTAAASDGTFGSYVTLTLSGASANNGTTYTYKVVASNATGNSADSATNTGYRGVGTLTYQWQRSAADSNASYSDISLATTNPYNDTGAPADGSGRYFQCVLNATGATQQISTNDRGFKGIVSITIEAGSGTVTYGIVATSKATTGGVNQTQTVRNTGNIAEDFDIKGQNSAHWTLGAVAGNAIYKHEWCTAICDTTPVWNAFTTSYAGSYLVSNIAANGTQDFDLQVTVPTSNQGASSENVSVFIQATQH